MRLLLDTHALVWWLSDNPKLSQTAAAAIADPNNDVVVSAASGWEIATKVRRQRWPEAAKLLAQLEQVLEANRIGVVPVLMRDSIRAGSFDLEHQDPFDRMIAAQVLGQDELTLVTIDGVFAEFGVKTLW